MKRNRNDVVAEIKTARDEAHTKARAYKNYMTEKYNYWRAISTVTTYNETLVMFEQGTEHQIPDMAATAHADFERARDDEILEVDLDGEMIEMSVGVSDLAVIDGRRDALASVADWMTTEENNR